LLFLGACSADPGTGPVDVHWDRDICERCRMVLSDRHYAAEVRVFPEGKRSKVYYFDDIGCAVIWLQDKPWKDDPKTQIWVTDHRTGNWIDARTATYVTGKVTPMEYGLGAQSDPAPDGLTFEQAKQHIFEVEERFNAHGVQLLERLKEQAKKRASAGSATQQ
ncbi:MAG TPA: hypothetical protein EYH03_06960, partial [Chromatiales bacterium]|nr:hypothetical protein [Chromatiales bacterium]